MLMLGSLTAGAASAETILVQDAADAELAPAAPTPAAELSNAPGRSGAAPSPDYLVEPPGGLLQAQVGVAGPNRAMDEFDLAFGRKQSYTDLRSLRDRIEISQRPLLNVDASRSTQSDNLDILTAEISQDIFFNTGRDRLRFGYQSDAYTPKVGDDVSQNAFGGNGTYRINDWAAVTGDFWVNVLDSGNLPRQVEPTYDLFVTLWPNDVIRVDLDTNRKIFDNIRSLQLGITADTFGASIDYSPSSDFRLSFRASDSFYTHGNDRQSAELEGVWRVRSNPVVQLGFRASGFQFSKRLNDGYFNPDAYESGEAMLRIQAPLNDKVDIELAGAGGIENSNPGGFKPLIRASLQLSYKVNKDWTLDGGAAYFSSRDTNSSGFARTTVSVGLHRRF